jgi:hypothetical protein
MGIYNFQARFVPMIMAGEKTHTIRANRVHPDKPENTLHLYTGLRQKGAKLLKRVKCTAVQEIVINRHGLSTGLGDFVICIDGHELSLDEREGLARRDGFKNFREMIRFWQEPINRLPFVGQIIHWKNDA